MLAAPRPLGSIAAFGSPLATAILSDWRRHPYCIAALSADDCWQQIRNIAVVTPAALLASDRLMRVFPK